MTTEDRILDYLDGSLKENESAELMHQLSVSPENRVILEQHIKLSELTRVAQKPYDVPAALEMSMARRLPAVIASESAVTAVGSRSLISSMLLLLRQYPMRFAMGGILTLLAGGALYWSAFTGTNPSTDTQFSTIDRTEPKTSTSEHSSSVTAPAATADQNGVSGGSAQRVTNGSNGTPIPRASASGPVSLSSHATRTVSDASNPNGLSQRSTSILNSNGLRDNAARSTHSSHVSTTPTNRPQDVTPIGAALANNTPVDHSNQNTPTSIGIAPQDVGAFTVPTTNVRSASTTDLTAIIPSDSRGRFRLSDPQPHDDGRRSNWAIRASIAGAATFLYTPTGGNAYATRTDGLVDLGVDFRLSPYWSIGVEFGQTTNQVLSPTSVITNTSDGVSHIETHATSTVSKPWFSRLALRATVNPYDALRWEGAIGAGGVFGSSGGLMFHAQAGAGITPGSDDALEFQAALVYSGVLASNLNSVAQAQGSASGPIEYTTVNLPSSKIYTSAFSLRIGLQYRLP